MSIPLPVLDPAHHEHHDFLGASDQALHDQSLQAALKRLTAAHNEGSRRGWNTLPDSDDVRNLAKRIKEHTFAHLDRYLLQLEASVKKLGGQVHWAETAEDARRIVIEIASKTRCKTIVKSKSMATEEIHLNPALEEAGLEVTETDYGEWIIQLAKERPSHIVAPAIHHTRETIAAILTKLTGEEQPPDPEVLAAIGRRMLREKFLKADMGISGVNFAVAETGSIVLISNEGNARLTTTCPRVHVAVMGIEKVIPRWQDLPVFLKVLARAATGQSLSIYTSILTGPRKAGEKDGPEEFHLVLLDNGRSRVLGTPFRESLQCIRCGACLNVCPVYRRIGGHAYGGIYSGPIGSVLTPLFDSVADNPHLPHASSLCGACQAACPLRINIPHMLIGLRELQHEGKGDEGRPRKTTAKQPSSSLERLVYWMWKQVLLRPWVYRWALWFGRWFARGKDGWVAKMPGPAAGWTKNRDFPAMAKKSFRDLWRTLKDEQSS
jgi:L-lactate dehydrogenase complex protein LldF